MRNIVLIKYYRVPSTLNIFEIEKCFSLTEIFVNENVKKKYTRTLKNIRGLLLLCFLLLTCCSVFCCCCNIRINISC